MYLGENVELEIGVKGSEDGREGIRRRCVEEEEDGGGHGSKQAAKDHGDRGTLARWEDAVQASSPAACLPHCGLCTCPSFSSVSVTLTQNPPPFNLVLSLSFSFNFLLGFSSNLMSP